MFAEWSDWVQSDDSGSLRSSIPVNRCKGIRTGSSRSPTPGGLDGTDETQTWRISIGVADEAYDRLDLVVAMFVLSSFEVLIIDPSYV